MESARKRIVLPALLCLSWLLAATAFASDGVEFIQPDLEDRLQSGEQIDLLLHFEMPDLTPAYEMDWVERGRWVHKQLTAAVESTQYEARKRMIRQGAEIQQLRLGNMMIVQQADFQTFDAIRNTPNVKRIYEKPEFQLFDEEQQDQTLGGGATANLDQIKATDVWNQLGFTGENIVVGLNDSSPRYTHELLVNNYRGNTGGGSFDHNYNWFDPNSGTSEPFAEFHGTLVVSIMAGNSGTNQTGVAPDADWIACGGCAGGSCAGVYQCLDWMVAPTDLNGANPNPDERPHVVNNSWGNCSTTYDSSLEPIWDSMYGAGVIPFFSNGNSSNCGYSSPPGLDTVGNPARAGRVMGIGSTTQTGGNYATHSNWGPTDNDNPGLTGGSFDHFGYPDLKPNVSAPGQGIPGAGSSSDTATTSSTGTSFASPHASGAAALMMSAAPCLIGDHQAIGTILMETANWVEYAGGGAGDPDVEPGVNHPNYAAGWGEIDMLAATQMAIEQCGPRGTLNGTVTDLDTGNPIEGVTVSTVDPESNVIETTTDAAGFYSMSLPATEAGQSYDIDYSRNGYVTTTITGFTINEDETLTLDIDLEAVPGETVSGQVTDANFPGTGVEGASLLFVDEDGFSYGPAETDVNGDYSIDLPPGVSYDVTITAEGYEELTAVVGVVSGPTTADYAINAGIIDLPATAALTVDRGDTGSTTITVNNTGTADAEIDLAFGGTGTVLGEDFEGTFPPDGWTVTDASSPACPWMSTDDYPMPGWDGIGSERGAGVDSDSCGSGVSVDTSLITPSFDLTGATVADLSFDLAIRDFGGTTVSLQISTDGGGSWDTLDTWVAEEVAYPGAAYVGQSYDISAYAGASDVTVRWRYESGWDYWVAVDNVEVTSDNAGAPWASVVPETVTVPQGGSVDVDLNVDATSMDAGIYNIPLMVTGGSAYDVTPTDFEVTVNPVPEIILPELVEMTVEYPTTGTETIDVQNIGGLSGDVDLTFEPDPFVEDFETGDFPPEGWTVTDSSSPACPWLTTDDYPMPSNFPGLVPGSTRGAAVDSDSCGSGVTVDTSLISPVINLGSPTPATLEFDFSQNDFGGTTTTVEATTDGGNSWQVLATYTGDVNTAAAATETIDLAPVAGNPEVQIRFRYTSGWDWYVYVDNVSIDLPPVDWANANPSLVTVPATSTVQTDIEVDTSLLDGPGVYEATMFGSVASPIAIAPTQLIVTVEPGPDLAGINGTVESLGYCGSDPFAAAGAEITINGVNNTYTATADENGFYEIFIPSDETPVDITASAVNHLDSTQNGVALVPADSITVDFSLDLDEPCIDTTPASFSATLELGNSDTQTLSIGNANGAGSLDWTLEEAEPTVLSASEGGNAGAGLNSDGHSGIDMMSAFGDELPAAVRVGPAGAFDCDGAQGLVIHDDGTIENGYSGNPAVATDVTVLEGFEPENEVVLGTVCVALLSLGPDTRDFELVVFDDDGTDGAPGTEIAAVPATATGLPDGIPDPIVWYTVDLTSENIVVSSGRVYIGARWEVSDPNVFLASDEDGPGGVGAGYFRVDQEAWSELGTVDTFPDYSAMFVRPQMQSPSGCSSPSEVAWLSFSSELGTVAPGGSEDVDVIIDTSSLAPGDYEASICVNSNDPQNPIVAVPVSLTVTAPPSFASVSGTVQSLGYCSANPEAAAGASVEIVSSSQTYNLTADGTGYYELFLDSAEGPVDVTASATDHDTQAVSGLALSAGAAEVVDFDLVLQAACATVTPQSITDSVGDDQVVDYTVTVGNADGAVDLSWALDIDSPAAAYESGLPEADVFEPAANGWDRASAQSTAERNGRAPVAKPGLQGGAIGTDFSEGFEDIATLPGSGWSLQNQSDPLGTSDWFQGNDAVFPAHEGPATSYIGANFNNTTGATGTISNWLLTPEVELNEGATISFWTRTGDGSSWPDRLEVRMSTSGASTDVGTGATDVGDFSELLLSINENLTVGGYPEAWTEYTIEVQGVPSGTTGRIGLRYFVTDAGPDGTNSNYIGIDTFSFTQPEACVDPIGAGWISVDTTNGTVAAGDTQDVQVTVDGAQLSNGVNEGFLCITTDDINADLLVVPLTIEGVLDAIFGDRFEQ